MRKILVTTALPYANGSIHLGHILEHIQADIWVRFHKMQKHQCYYICADDSHGTSIMLSAEKLNIHPEELIKNVKKEHLEDFRGFYINYDNYYTTHSEENKELVELFYKELKQNNKIYSKDIEQLFDPERKIFLPDRFIKGSCPNCKSEDQYGDSCEICGATYNPTDLINPYSTISGAKPIIKESKHFFFKLTECQDFLSNWVRSSSVSIKNKEQKHLQLQVFNKMQEWLSKGLQDWDISRDSPYFGFQIPGEQDKYFYVWMDAPIGYFASFKNYCIKNNLDYDGFFNDKQSEMYHFIGKDILYFHSLFWPAILHSINLKTPTAIFAHGFLTLNSQKMSKSKGTFITAKSYLNLGLNPEWLRYYFASKLNSNIEDIDINLKDFVTKVNSDLIGKYVNIISRSVGFIHKKFNGLLAQITKNDLITLLQDKSDIIASLYENREYSKVIKEIMLLTDIVNSYIDDEKPWILSKDDINNEKLHQLCSVLVNAFKILTIYLSPVLPNTSHKVSVLLNQEPFIWDDINTYLPSVKINKYEHLITRIEDKMIDDLITKNKESINNSINNNKFSSLNCEPFLTDKCSFDDFLKVDMRVAKVLDCEKVEGSEKLLKFDLDIGFEKRTIFSGVANSYPKPKELVGKLVIVIVNFPFRKMAKFGISEGMILSAADNDKELFLLEINANAKPGMKVG